MPNQSTGYDDSKNLRRNREVRERSTSSISSQDFIRLQAEERTKRANGIEKSMARQKEAQEQIDKQLVNRENKDTDSPDTALARTEEYEAIRAKTLQAAEGRIKENTMPDSLNVEGLSRKRQIELSQQALNEQRAIRYSMQKSLVDTKPESDTSTPVPDNTNASIYKREIEQIQELIDTDKPVYAYFDSKKSSVYITDKVENAQAKFKDDAITNLQLGDQLNGIRRVDLEYAKMGVEDEKYRLKPELDITAPQVENPQDKKAEGELKIGDQDTKTNNDQRLTSVKDFVGAAYADKLPVWMQKDDIRIGDFMEYQQNKSLTPEQFMRLAQNKSLESETMPADAWRDTLKQEQEHVDQREADVKEKLSQVEKTFAEDVKGKRFNEIYNNLGDLYERISKSSVSEEVSKQAEEQKDRAEMYPIQIEAFFKLKEVTPSLNEQYEAHYNRMVKDMQESVEFIEKALDQGQMKSWDQLNGRKQEVGEDRFGTTIGGGYIRDLEKKFEETYQDFDGRDMEKHNLVRNLKQQSDVSRKEVLSTYDDNTEVQTEEHYKYLEKVDKSLQGAIQLMKGELSMSQATKIYESLADKHSSGDSDQNDGQDLSSRSLKV